MRKHALGLVGLVLFAGCTRRPEERATRDPKAPTDGGKIALAIADAAPPPPVADEDREPPHPSRLELVALRLKARFGDDTGAFKVADLVGKILVTGRTPLAWADGKGALVRDPSLERGLDPGPPGMWSGAHRAVHAVAGTWPGAVYMIYGYMPEARGVQYDLPLHRLGEGGWKVDRPLGNGVLPGGLSAFGPRGVLVAAWATGDDNAFPAGWDPSPPMWLAVGDDPKPAPLKLATDLGGGTTRATRDGHVYLLGLKRQAPGVWLAHLAPGGGPTTHHAIPGSEGCGSKKMRESGLQTSLHVIDGGRAIVALESPIDACPRMKPGLYEAGPKGLVRSAIAAPTVSPSEGNFSQVVGMSPDGTLWLTDSGRAGLWRARAATSADAGVLAPEPIPMPRLVTKRSAKGPLDVKLSFDPPPNDKVRACEPTAVVAREVDHEEDLWVVARCDIDRQDYEVVLRFGRPQAPVVVRELADGGAP